MKNNKETTTISAIDFEPTGNLSADLRAYWSPNGFAWSLDGNEWEQKQPTTSTKQGKAMIETLESILRAAKVSFTPEQDKVLNNVVNDHVEIMKCASIVEAAQLAHEGTSDQPKNWSVGYSRTDSVNMTMPPLPELGDKPTKKAKAQHEIDTAAREEIDSMIEYVKTTAAKYGYMSGTHLNVSHVKRSYLIYQGLRGISTSEVLADLTGCNQAPSKAGMQNFTGATGKAALTNYVAEYQINSLINALQGADEINEKAIVKGDRQSPLWRFAIPAPFGGGSASVAKVAVVDAAIDEMLNF